MSNYFHEENTPDSFFNKDVVRLLFKYILRYRKHLYLAFFFVSAITSITLTVPFLSRITIDRYIIKSGYLLRHDKAFADQGSDFKKLLSKSIVLSEDTLFTFKNNLSGFSADQIRKLTAEGILSESTFTLIESPAADKKLEKKIREALSEGVLQAFPNNRYLLKDNSSSFFTVSEIALLRIHDIRQTGLMVLIILGLFIFQFIASYFQIITLMKLSQYAMRDLRIDLFSHITSLELSFFDKNPIGKLVNRITNDIESLNELFSTVLVTLVQDVLILSGITIIMFFTDIHLALVVSISFPALFIVMLLFRIKARQAYRIIRTRIAELNSFLNENITNIRIIQIFVQELRHLTNSN
jgi:ABC-type multidrug transport system fused ATPase/permease subunit